MEKVFISILNMSLTGTFIITAICLARLFLKKAPKIISYALWAVVGFRLIFPYSIQSLFSLLPFKAVPIPQDIGMQALPRIDSGIKIIDNTVSAALPTAIPAASVNPLQIWIAIGSYIWLFGISIMLIYSLISIVLLKRCLLNASHIESNLYEAGNLKTPFVIGLFKPKIYIPAGLSQEELSYIVLHEQTHIKRHDHTIKMLAYLVLCLHWFNPLVWIAFIRMSEDMEMSCDERVLKKLGGNIKNAYSLSLVRVAAGHKILNGSPLAFGEGDMKKRIKNILNFKKHSRVIMIAAVLLAAVLTVGFTGNSGAKGEHISSALTPTIKSGRTYYLENPTKKQELKQLTSVTLYIDGQVWLKTPLISSYMTPPCTYSIANNELLIHAVIEDKEEGAFGVKNGDVIARFMIIDDYTIEFKSATVPLFAKADTQYVYTPPEAYNVQEWLNYSDNPQMMPRTALELELPEYPDTVFQWTPDEVKSTDSNGEKVLFYGMPVWNVYLADLTGDGLPEFCATVSNGSGIIDERIVVHDYAAGKTYDLNDRGYYNYSLFLDEGKLMVRQTKHPSPKDSPLGTGELAIIDGELTAIGIGRGKSMQEPTK